MYLGPFLATLNVRCPQWVQFLPFTAILAQHRLLSGKRTYRDLARGIRPPRPRRHFIRNDSSIPQLPYLVGRPFDGQWCIYVQTRQDSLSTNRLHLNCDARKWAMVVTMNNIVTFVEVVALTLIVVTLIGLLFKGHD